MIKFKKLSIKNFLSIGNKPVEIQLDDAPTTLIIGDNGCGKSCLLDAICFVLYNKAFRKINKPQLVNTQNEKDMVVEIEFEIGTKKYRVKRGYKPTLFEIYIDGKVADQNSKSKDYQSILEKQILQMNYKAFTQVVILGSASFVPFMQLPAADRRSIIEEILDIRIFSIMHTLLKQNIQEQKEQLKDVDYEIALLSEKIKIHEKNLTIQTEANRERIKVETARIYEANHIISDNQEKQKTISEQISQIKKQLVKIEELNLKKKQLLDFGKGILHKKNAAEASMKLMESNDSCPTCEQTITATHTETHKATKTKEIVFLDESQIKLEERLLDVNETLRKLNVLNTMMTDAETEMSKANQNIQAQQQYISKLNEEIQDLLDMQNQPKNDQNSEISICVIERTSAESKRTDLVDDRHYSDIAYKMLKDSGIKTKIIQKYIPVINKLINHHLEKLNFFVSFTLDENFNEIIKSRHRDTFSYASFSEGEKARIDIALLLTWREIAKLKSSAATNLMILDEIFDSSLDSDGIEELLKIFVKLSRDNENTNIIVISHKQDAMIDKFDRVIRVTKSKKGFSQYNNEG